MGQRDPRIDAYISEAATFAQPILKHLREQVHRGCPAATETIKWGSPFFEYAGKILCFMAAFKAHCAFGFWNPGMRKELIPHRAKTKTAMGGLGRITSVADLPNDATLIRFVQQAAKLNESPKSIRARSTAARQTRELAVPADLAAALQKNKSVAKKFAMFTPSQRKEYIQWIRDAKRDETRRNRVATTIEWVGQGKPRNWKYLKG